MADKTVKRVNLAKNEYRYLREVLKSWKSAGFTVLIEGADYVTYGSRVRLYAYDNGARLDQYPKHSLFKPDTIRAIFREIGIEEQKED